MSDTLSGRSVTTVVFDIGETLIDETGMWTRAALAAGVTPLTLMGVLGGLIARGEHHNEAWGILGVEHPSSTWNDDDWYPDALPCLDRLRAAGFRVCGPGACGTGAGGAGTCGIGTCGTD